MLMTLLGAGGGLAYVRCQELTDSKALFGGRNINRLDRLDCLGPMLTPSVFVAQDLPAPFPCQIGVVWRPASGGWMGVQLDGDNPEDLHPTNSTQNRIEELWRDRQ